MLSFSFAFLFPGTSVSFIIFGWFMKCLGKTENKCNPSFFYHCVRASFLLSFQILHLKHKHFFLLFFSPHLDSFLYFSIFDFSLFSHVLCSHSLLLVLHFVLCLLRQALFSKTSRQIFCLNNTL